MTQSSTINIQPTPSGELNVKAVKEAIRLIQKTKRREELDKKRWRMMNLYGVHVAQWQMPIMNLTM